MTHATRFAAVAVLVALAATACAPQESVSESATDNATNAETDPLQVCWESSETLSQDAHVGDVTRPASTVARAVGLG